jgi:hypothetical protein
VLCRIGPQKNIANQRPQRVQVLREQPDALSELFSRHGVLIEQETELPLVEDEPRGRLGRTGRVEPAWEMPLVCRERIEQRRRNGEAIAAGERLDLAGKGRDQEHRRVGAGHRLGQREQQGQVAVDMLALEGFGRPDALSLPSPVPGYHPVFCLARRNAL